MTSIHVANVIFYSLVLNVRFEQSTYSVDEDAGPAQPVLILNNSSSMGFNVPIVQIAKCACT